jgi:hypothetical protein
VRLTYGRRSSKHRDELNGRDKKAIEWLKRCPDPTLGEEGIIGVRPMFEAEDFGKELMPELRKQEEELRRTIEARRR